ncbi:Glycosyltransferase involved in cell wall bisynthesis [Planctomycetales bacterium 10988]|nr:Glycosyltransferase involved in cell wall bisynthesis [Planctomycetales bacterium 10988]
MDGDKAATSLETLEPENLQEMVLNMIAQDPDQESPEQHNQRVALLERLLGITACRSIGLFSIPEDFVLSVVIPVYNEKNTVRHLLERVAEQPVRKEMIVIDDCSTDGTRELLEDLKDEIGFRYFKHEVNQGKGAALKTGFEKATGTAVIIQDADLEYDPSEYLKLIQPIVEGQADAVFGSRFIGESHRVLYFWHSMGNHFLTWLSNMRTNLNLTDMETCYKVFRLETLNQITPDLKEKRFGIEPEMTAKIARIPGVRIYERPITYSGRTYEQGKKITWKDGFRALWCIWKYR